MQASEPCIPAAAVELDGAMPQPGDPITFEMGATVTRVADGQVYYTPATANGQPIPAAKPAADAAPALDDEETIRAQARAADEQEDLL